MTPRANPAREAAAYIVRTLQDTGHVAYFAGGCVRDELLGLEPKDYDVATDATPDDIERLFPKTKPVGKSFGVVLVRDGRCVTEVATFREEGTYTDKRRPDEVRFSDARADAKRRDFTINALFLDPLDTQSDERGRVIDFVGGLEDLGGKIVRAVGDPDERLSEDHLRALRAVRFASRFGFPIEGATERAIRAHARELEGVSRERVGDELRRILAHPNRSAGAELIQRLHLDGPVLHDQAPVDTPVHTLASLGPEADAMLALAAWATDRLRAATRGAPNAEQAAGIVGRLRSALVLANDETQRLRDLLVLADALDSGWEGATVAQRKRWGGHPVCVEALGLLRARSPESADGIARDIETLARTPSGLSPTPVITGDDLVDAGYRPGPSFGKWLEDLYDAQLEDRLSTRDEALAWLRERAGAPENGNS